MILFFIPYFVPKYIMKRCCSKLLYNSVVWNLEYIFILFWKLYATDNIKVSKSYNNVAMIR